MLPLTVKIETEPILQIRCRLNINQEIEGPATEADLRTLTASLEDRSVRGTMNSPTDLEILGDSKSITKIMRKTTIAALEYPTKTWIERPLRPLTCDMMAAIDTPRNALELVADHRTSQIVAVKSGHAVGSHGGM